EKANDLFFGESALLHVRHSPSVTDFSLLLIGKAQGEQIRCSKRCGRHSISRLLMPLIQRGRPRCVAACTTPLRPTLWPAAFV
ncbi:hypothetical protein, partial [Vogesella indigofera]|uniref:hypothetical protein n=1 Tax=Vogesella indigofera TaxID=45465 RepID=UPI00234E44B0